jgi:hypothetical protein
MSAKISFNDEKRKDSKLLDFDVQAAIQEMKNQMSQESDEKSMH